MMFVLNILLGLAWMVLIGGYSPSDFFHGVLLGYSLLWLVRDALPPSRYFLKVPQAIGLLLFFMWELLRANLKVAYEVITPRNFMVPGIVAVPIDLESDAAITLFTSMITLTPGTLSLDVSTDRSVVYVHTMYVHDGAEFQRELKEGLERRIKEVLE